ncbi:MAG: Inosine-5'-monophosphate dehydrogenase [Candidatus Gottesmanbacteria bacterium GW2011_GWA1_42_26]|uniref:Inosine-5'-monophosphate dehydrogenase n=1 Tax=Candidatus Gottesmanbacteria bacterium GW2011_GWB1_44_11c TaxID=1618447 RepID=A0A0G1GUE5_9BACT|nr:MAG: Inosine-5'-monophosphate dehydrogenase [Candidatus Gottesmanbacteria bacterium GW2011_GWA1_42_26]KKT38240.1 MAG: Inosine-5'-monophosphate dehydrogenase [Candidatus Gottesmanbacteria bacterium GW2011_GWB1_44_11c]HCM81813.1 IMP dehydrogenase [Patescibacteria group bacterium]
MDIPTGLTYDDVLLVPQRSFIDHRLDVSTKTKLTRHIDLSIPLVSANMDTVTESGMAIALAREGGIGIIHRFMTIQDQVEEVKEVKRTVGFLLYAPYTIRPKTPMQKIWQISREKHVHSFIVVDGENHVLGILSKRDYMFEGNNGKEAGALMTPFEKLITATEKITITEAKKLFHHYKIEKLPLIDKSRHLKGLITAHSVSAYEKYPFSTKDSHGCYRVGAAVGVVKDYIERAHALVSSGVDALVVDVAHGHNDVALRAMREIRKRFKHIDLIGGNVATKEGAEDLIECGVDGVKVGIGPGGLCTTRIVAGVGVPQLTAVLACSTIAKKHRVPVIADGGTNYPGDIPKALAAGAATCMLAGWFAGTDESPGGIILRKGMKYKVHRGSASFLATADRQITLENKTEQQLNSVVPEGVESLIPYKGSVSDVIAQLLGALRSGMSYCNAGSIDELQNHAHFIRITDAGLRESKSHNITEL